MFELRDLERFMTVVEHRNFGRAAIALGMTQPQLSRRISNLERDLDAQLFSRAHRQIELTPAGELLAREARAVLAQAAIAERALRGAARGATGNVRLGTRSISRFKLLPEAIRLLHRTHPQAAVIVTEPLTGLLLGHLREGTLDMTLVRGPVNLEGGLELAKLRSDPLLIALPKDHRLSARRVVDVHDLADESFVEVAFYRSLGYRELTRGVCSRAGFVPHVVQAVETAETVVICVAAGIGVALMHDASRELPIDGVVYRPIRPHGPAVDLVAVWRRDDTNSLIPVLVRCLQAAAQTVL
jgi:DNA-binding transcriptional LysR family regulator